MDIQKLLKIKTNLTSFLPLDVAINCLRVEGEDEDGNILKGGQYILQQMQLDTREVKQLAYIVTNTELTLCSAGAITDKIIQEWETPTDVDN